MYILYRTTVKSGMSSQALVKVQIDPVLFSGECLFIRLQEEVFIKKLYHLVKMGHRVTG